MADIIDLRFTTPLDPVPDFIYDELKAFVRECNTYHPQPLIIRKPLAEKFHLTEDCVLMTNGVDEAIQLVIKAYGKSAHIFTPTEYSTFFQFCPSVTTHDSLMGDSYQISTDTIHGATLILLANPNNPIGYSTRKTIIQLLENNPNAIVVIDEIYSEYAPEFSVVDLISTYPNLIVFRGFSKSYGLAGIRLGYALSNRDVIEKLSEYIAWANVSYLSCAVGAIALKNETYYQELRETIMKRKASLVQKLLEKNFIIFPSCINTITIKFNSEQQAAEFCTTLHNNGIEINQGEGGGKTGQDRSFVSFVVGTEIQVERLVKILV